MVNNPKLSKTERIPRLKRIPMSYERIAILMAVADGPIDRAAISDVIVANSIGVILVKKSTLYHLISELIEQDYIKRQGSLTLTDKGWRVLHDELSRIEQERLILKQRLHK